MKLSSTSIYFITKRKYKKKFFAIFALHKLSFEGMELDGNVSGELKIKSVTIYMNKQKKKEIP